MIARSVAIVLRMVDFKESSKIVTLLTKDFGKLAVLARSVHKPGSKFAGLLQPGNVLDIVFYHKPSRSVQNLSEASLAGHTWKIRSDIEKMAIASATLEMLEQVTHDNEDCSDLFDFASNLLYWLHETTESPKNLFPYIQVRLAELLGVGLQSQMENNNAVFFLNINDGNVDSAQASGLSYRLTEGQAWYFAMVFGGKKSRILKKEFAKGEIKNLIHHLDVYLKHHIQDVRDRRSDFIFQQILH